ncbi:MAG: hypothetical protein QOF48_3678 [Verrucomicrobiota bacterium]
MRVILAGAVILAACAIIYFSLCPLPPRFDRAPHRGLGEVLGAEALKLRDASSRFIVIIRDTESFKAPAATAELEGFRQALKKGGAKISSTHILKLDPLRVVGVPPGDFFELLRKSSESDVIVSFQGPPALSPEQLAKLGSKRPHVLAVCSGSLPRQIDLQKIFAQKLLHAAVISRPDAASPAGTSRGARAAFDRMFKLVTEQDIDDLAPARGSHP